MVICYIVVVIGGRGGFVIAGHVDSYGDIAGNGRKFFQMSIWIWHTPRYARRMMGMNMFMDLNLSDDQKDQVQTIIKTYRDQRENTADEFHKTMRETMFDAIFAEEFNEKNVRKAFRESSEGREEMVVQKAKMIAEIETILDPEQIELLKERKTQIMEKGRGCGGFRHISLFDTLAAFLYNL